MALRHRSRHLRATIYTRLHTQLNTLGWISAPINFTTTAVRVIDYQPEERGEIVMGNTVAVSLGDVAPDVDQELGAGLRSALYPVFIDVYMADQALSDAICDDIRDIFDCETFPLVDQITGLDTTETIEIEQVFGPDRPAAAASSIEQFRRTWRVMRMGACLYYQSST